MHALLEHLGHDRCVVSAGDLGGVVAQDLSLRFEGLVERMVLFNTIAPFLPAEYEAAGLGSTPPVNPQTSGPRLGGGPGAFTPEESDHLTEPFGDAGSFRASIANYEYVGGARTAPEVPRMLELNPTPTLVLYGPEDHVIPADFPRRMEVAFPEIVGPFEVAGAGHFLMWERPRVLNRAIEYFCRDLLAQSHQP